MHVILTHENADFDAVASLLAAALLYPQALAVVPHTCNQNVRDFLTLYWDELPFIESRERPKGSLNQITAVDSQYIPQVKGWTKQTKIRIIDHHDASDHLPVKAETTFLETGATVTFLVEEIARANIGINAIQATLMLLGIYEDCGSLTYGSTTPRDVRAAAWLLEQGGQLDILREFLNYALNPAQRKLYNKIAQNIKSHTIHGNQVMISAVRSDERVPEISSIAHRMRDLYDPDGLFLLVHIDDGHSDFIQLVARATTDTIHVGQIAEHFGGGGHPRASAAHIDQMTLEQANQALQRVLQTLVQPAATVRQIMSFSVRTLSPQQTVQEAAEMATRYGHEGYQVVEDNQVVGIITRREIDKAMQHKLDNAAISQFMHQGEITIAPDDTIETLQKVMLQAHVGQVPVLEDGNIIGVVTRTDLINLWGTESESSTTNLNVAEILSSQLPSALLDLLQDAGRQAEEIDCSLYVVGGFVRDLLLETSSLDVDLVVEGDAIALAKAMQAKYGGYIHSHSRFGTANWIIEGLIEGIDRLDFVTARTEFYRHPTALPEIEQSSIKQDLHRRDFTINTLAICLSPNRYGDVLDYYGGYADLQSGRIRVLHSLSFVEDPTRILRAIRLEQRLGFEVGTRTLEHLENALDLIQRVSRERIFHELKYTFDEKVPEKAIVRMSNLGVLQAIHPSLSADDWFVERSQQLRTGLAATPWATIQPDILHYLGLLTFPLPPVEAQVVVERLRIKNNTAKALAHVQEIKALAPKLAQLQRPSEIFAMLNRFSDDALLVAWLALAEEKSRDNLIRFSQDLRQVQPIIDGNYLIEEFQLKPSPRFTKILTQLRDAKLDGVVSTLAEEHQLVESLLASSTDSDSQSPAP